MRPRGSTITAELRDAHHASCVTASGIGGVSGRTCARLIASQSLDVREQQPIDLQAQLRSKFRPMTVKTRSLKDRALRAGMWATLFTIAATGMRFGSSLIMTRLLVPDVFGVVALAGVLFTIIGLLFPTSGCGNA